MFHTTIIYHVTTRRF